MVPIRTRILSFGLAIAGVAVAGYLTVVHFNQDVLVCNVGDCGTVQNSKYAEVAGIPIAIFGLGMYLVLLGIGLLRWVRAEHSFTLTTAAFAITLAGTIYAAYLTYLEIAVIEAICQWCVASALITLGILLVEGGVLFRMLGTPQTLD